MTLRQLLTHSEKCSRDLIEHLQSTLLMSVSDFRDLSRPVRRRSHYPTMLAVQNALRKLMEGHQETQTQASYLQELMLEIREHAAREKVNKM
jgi:hypothetical protein